MSGLPFYQYSTQTVTVPLRVHLGKEALAGENTMSFLEEFLQSFFINTAYSILF